MHHTDDDEKYPDKDLEECRQVEELLVQNNHQLQLIMDSGPTLISYTDSDLKYRWVNKVFEEWLGYTLEEVQGKYVWEILGEETWQYLKPYAEKALKGERVTYEMKLPSQKYGEQWINATYTPEMDSSGRVLGFIVHVVNIENRKKIEEDLVRERNFSETVINSIPGVLYLFDNNGKFIRWNRNLEEITGFSSQEVAIMNPLDFFIPQDRQKVAEAIGDVFIHGKADVEAIGSTKDGRKLVYYFSSSLVFIDGVPYIIGAGVDVTKRKLAEENLLREKAFSESAINSMPGVFYLFDNNGQLIRWNKNLEDVTGYSSQEIREMDPRSFFNNDDIERIVGCAERAFSEGKVSLEADLLCKDGRKIPYYFTGFRMYIDDVPYLIGTGIDITERVRIQKEMMDLNNRLQERAQELTESNANLEQFAFIASHDLKEPLNVIGGYAQLLKEQLQGKIDDDSYEFIKTILDNANRMQRMISSLLELSRVSTRGQTLAPVDVNRVLEAALANLEERINEAQASVTSESLPVIMADEAQLTQVFQNLIGNAIKYRREEPPVIKISARKKDKEWIFSIADNGIGIEPENYDKLFKIFQRISKSSDVAGSGIGLAIVERIIKRHGGKVWVESAPGIGSTFYFSIPARRNRFS